MRNASVFLIVSFVATGCGWESDGTRRLAERYADTAGAADATADEVAPHEVNLGDVGGTGLAGRWAVQVVVTGTMQPMTAPWPYTETTLFLTDVTDGAATAEWVFCDQQTAVEATPASLASKTVFPVKLQAALEAKPLSVAISADGLAASTVVWLWGLDAGALGDVTDKPSGIEASSPAVVDEDDDGNPGVTVEVVKPLAGMRYQARWERFDLQAGSLSGDGQRIEGALAADAVEFVVGASKELLIKPSNLAVTPGTGHTWRLRRVPATYTCANLRQDAAGLFPAP